MTHITSARLRNFMRYKGEHELALGPGCFAVVAQHELDGPERSNYLGKSSFLAALRWGLEGVKVEDADTLDELISWREDAVGVDLELSNGWFLSREKRRNKSATLVLEPPVNSGLAALASTEAQEELERQLGVDRDDRLTTCWAEQGELAVMVRKTTTSAKLTAMVERWLELDKLVDAGARTLERLASCSGELTAAVAEHTELLERGDVAIIAQLEQRLAELERQQEANTREADRIRMAREQHAERRLLGDRIDELERVSRERHLNKPPAPPLLPEDADPPIDRAAVEQQRLEAFTKVSTVEVEKRRLKQLVKGEFDGACPVSAGFECPAKADINARGEPNRKALAAAELAHTGARLDHDTLARQLGADDARKRRAAERDRAEAREQERVRGLDERIAILTEAIRKAKDAGVTPLREGEQAPPQAVAPNSAELDRVRSELADRRQAVELLPEAAAAVSAAAKRSRAHRLAVGILGPEGARRRAAQGAVGHIEAEANRMLAGAGIGITVRAAWGRDTGVPAEQCSECGNAFPRSATVKECQRCGHPRGVKVEHLFRWRLSNTSGAARDLAGLALRCAGFGWLRAVRGVTWSVAALDEVTSQCDRAHRRAVSAGIRRLLAGTFEQAFVTAHEPGVLEACDRRIEIVGSGDWSSIRVAA